MIGPIISLQLCIVFDLQRESCKWLCSRSEFYHVWTTASCTCTRCGPHFGTTVEAVHCLTCQTEWNVRTCKKETKHTLFWGGGGRERTSLRCRQVPKAVKDFFVLQFCSWDGSFRHGEMKIWLCLYFQHVTRYIGTDFVEEGRQKMQRSENEHFFREGCCDRKECIFKHSE